MLFDILGFISPFIITAKMILQELWIIKHNWDKPIPDSLTQKWHSCTTQLDIVKKHQVPRYVSEGKAAAMATELHGFSDASEAAFGAAVYLKQHHYDGNITPPLVTAKARVKPVKKRSIPQLELEAAKLLTQLIVYAAKVLEIHKDNIHTWTDSAADLGWLRKMPCRLRTFQASRVAFIQEQLPTTT